MYNIEKPACAKRKAALPFSSSFQELFSFKAIATSAAIRRAVARVPHVNFAERTIIACTIVLAFGHAATDSGVHITAFFIHHIQKSSLNDKVSVRKFSKEY